MDIQRKWFTREAGSTVLWFDVIKYLLLIPALLVAAVSLLTVVRAPDYILAWKLAILAGEYGHWLALLAMVLGVLGCVSTDGIWRYAIVGLSIVATGCFLRPALSARRLAASLPAQLSAAFGPQSQSRPVFSWARLFLGDGRRTSTIVTTRSVGRPDGNELSVDIYRASATPDEQPKPKPCVVVIHGGGWDSGDRTQLPEWNHWLVSKGFVVAAVSYRLAPRWQWPAQREDVLTAIAWLKTNAAEFGLDPTQFVVLGRSAGGQIAAAVGYGSHDSCIRGVVALYAPHDMPFVWSVSREDDVLSSLKLMRQYLGGSPEGQRVARYASASGQALARADSPPTLLIHGDPDTLSWVRHSERLSARLEELHVRHYFLRLPWATHAFDFNPDGPGGQLTDYSLEWFLKSVVHSTVG